MEYLAAFRSRSQTMKLYQAAKQSGISCSVINTPREASAGCGISLSYDSQNHREVQSLFYRGGYSSFAGFFKVTRTGRFTKVEKL